MQYDYTYEVHKAVETAQFRHRERDLGHRRALKAGIPTDSIVARMMGALKRRRPATPRPPVINLDGFVRTNTACRLADGAMGRIAVRESGGDLIEVCVLA